MLGFPSLRCLSFSTIGGKQFSQGGNMHFWTTGGKTQTIGREILPPPYKYNTVC